MNTSTTNQIAEPQKPSKLRMIPEAEIERVKRQTDLLALVRSRGIEMKLHGSKDWIGLCPFHQDHQTPNFIVTPGKGLFHCMACGAAGNPIQFIARHDGVSFRHAFELLSQGGLAVYAARLKCSVATVPILPCPLDAQADDATLLKQVAAYYHQRIKLMPQARAYLASRGLDQEETIQRFQIGFADRTLGLRLPDSNRKEGDLLRSRLMQLGVWRKNGREHFNGCAVIPLRSENGNIVSFYGRRCGKVMLGVPDHLYPSGEHRGLFNPEALDSPEIILCEAVLDALTFWANGFKNVTCIFGTEGFTDELWKLILQKKVSRVRLAYDADEAGERAAERDAARLASVGIEVYRIKFPWKMDANEYAQKVTPADKSLALLIHASVWLGSGKPSPVIAENTLAPASSSLAADLAAEETKPEKTTKEENLVAEVKIENKSILSSELERRGDAWFMQLEEREYRVTGIEKTLGTDGLKITLRIKTGDPSTSLGTSRFHIDQIDLCRDNERRRFIERAAEETALHVELLKHDMGKLLLAVEREQIEIGKPVEQVAPKVLLTPDEREEAIQWLTQPKLIDRLKEAFAKTGIIGEEHNVLVAYLACVSRKLERPLAIIIQSASAAGKSTLMDAVLSFFPEEERVKYSAMTGQSLYYLGETNLKHKILAVVEEAGAEKANYALKLLQSEGELVIASTGKDPETGKMVTHEYRLEGPVTIILTTTAIEIDEELLNRCLVLTVDESQEQTRRIHQAQRERRSYAGLAAREEKRNLLRKLRNAQRLLQPLEVINPYAHLLEFPFSRTRTRRDNEKYLTMMDASCLLHQYQRPRNRKEINGRIIECVEVTLEDVALANQLAPEVLGRSLDELPPQTRALLKHVREMARGKSSRPFLFSRRSLCEASGWSLTQVRLHLERLVDHEYLAIRHGRFGSQFVYEFLMELDTSETAAHIKLIDIEELHKKYGCDEQPGGFLEGVAGGGKIDPSGCSSYEKAA